jgi:hypothetical protein
MVFTALETLDEKKGLELREVNFNDFLFPFHSGEMKYRPVWEKIVRMSFLDFSVSISNNDLILDLH